MLLTLSETVLTSIERWRSEQTMNRHQYKFPTFSLSRVTFSTDHGRQLVRTRNLGAPSAPSSDASAGHHGLHAAARERLQTGALFRGRDGRISLTVWWFHIRALCARRERSESVYRSLGVLSKSGFRNALDIVARAGLQHQAWSTETSQRLQCAVDAQL